LSTWTKTEAVRRVRVAAMLVRHQEMFPSQWLVEIAMRIAPVHVVGRVPTRDDVWSNEDNDDLEDFTSISQSKFWDNESQIRQEGYVAHLSFTSEEELIDIIPVWLGDENHEPQIIGKATS
jgi:hypothetical protein